MRNHLRRLLTATVLLCAPSASGQQAPIGGHQGGRASDTGFGGTVGATGQVAASVPLDLPPSRAGLPIPVAVVHVGGGRVGAAGAGWTVPLWYVERSVPGPASFAHRKPAWQGSATTPAPPTRGDQVFLAIGGSPQLMLAVGDGSWRAPVDGQDMRLIKPVAAGLGGRLAGALSSAPCLTLSTKARSTACGSWIASKIAIGAALRGASTMRW
jgi:hypothetical protein